MWKAEGMDLCVKVFGVVSMDEDAGMIQVVERAETVSRIQIVSCTGIECGTEWCRRLGDPRRPLGMSRWLNGSRCTTPAVSRFASF